MRQLSGPDVPAESHLPPGGSLRSQSLRGGAWLVVREGGGITIRLLGVLLLTRLLGPGQFGVYAGAASVVTFLAAGAQLGAEVLLIRRPVPPTRRQVHTVTALLLVTSTAVALAAAAASLLVDRLDPGNGYTGVFRILLISVPVNVLWAPAQAALERGFRYRQIGLLEIGGDLVLYAVAIPLAATGLRAYGAAVGYLAWQTVLLVGAYRLARLRPGLAWDRPTLREALAFGLRYSTGNWFYRAEEVVSPLVVGPVLGGEAVGYIALAQRLVDTLGFVGRVTFRLSIVALSRVGADLERLRRVHRDGAALQVFGVAPATALFCTVSTMVVPLAFGREWLPLTQVLPYLALATLISNAVLLHFSVLLVRDRESAVTRVNALRFGLLAAGAAALVPPLGLLGFGLARVGALSSYVLLERELHRIFVPSYEGVLRWVAAFAPALFVPVVADAAGPAVAALLWLPLLAVLARTSARRQLQDVARELVSAVRAKGAE